MQSQTNNELTYNLQLLLSVSKAVDLHCGVLTIKNTPTIHTAALGVIFFHNKDYGHSRFFGDISKDY